MACAALAAATPLLAQVRSAPDSILKARADSIVRADSVQGRLPQSELPVATEVGMSHRWNRDSLFSSGALTLADFLDRVPGLSTLRARFYLAPQVGSYNGDVAKVRLFLDGARCTVYEARPSQCRTFPFWSENLGPKGWTAEVRKDCEGLGRGRRHSPDEIVVRLIEDQAREQME